MQLIYCNKCGYKCTQYTHKFLQSVNFTDWEVKFAENKPKATFILMQRNNLVFLKALIKN